LAELGLRPRNDAKRVAQKLEKSVARLMLIFFQKVPIDYSLLAMAEK